MLVVRIVILVRKEIRLSRGLCVGIVMMTHVVHPEMGLVPWPMMKLLETKNVQDHAKLVNGRVVQPVGSHDHNGLTRKSATRVNLSDCLVHSQLCKLNGAAALASMTSFLFTI